MSHPHNTEKEQNSDGFEPEKSGDERVGGIKQKIVAALGEGNVERMCDLEISQGGVFLFTGCRQAFHHHGQKRQGDRDVGVFLAVSAVDQRGIHRHPVFRPAHMPVGFGHPFMDKAKAGVNG